MKKSLYPESAEAVIHGNVYAPWLKGNVWFYDTPEGTRVDADISGLPPNGTGFYGFHVHTAGQCRQPDFSSAQGHYNPGNVEHPRHAGDLPNLLATDTMEAHLSFVTTRFSVSDVIGRSVIIHQNRDDYTSQPSGDAGPRIGCGIIYSI